MALKPQSVTPNTRTLDLASMVNEADPKRYEQQAGYIFSNGREFKDPGSQGGAYTFVDGAIDQEQSDASTPARQPDILQEDFGRLLQE